MPKSYSFYFTNLEVVIKTTLFPSVIFGPITITQGKERAGKSKGKERRGQGKERDNTKVRHAKWMAEKSRCMQECEHHRTRDKTRDKTKDNVRDNIKTTLETTPVDNASGKQQGI